MDARATPPDSVIYPNALGNLSAMRSPAGVWRQYVKDAIGRSTDVENLADRGSTIRQIPTSQVRFDPTRRAAVDAASLEVR